MAKIRQAWQSYCRDVIPKTAGTVQITETRRAFYAGAWEVICVLQALTPSERHEMIDLLRIEASRFKDSVGKPTEGRV
jgi:hypothetical protein